MVIAKADISEVSSDVRSLYVRARVYITCERVYLYVCMVYVVHVHASVCVQSLMSGILFYCCQWDSLSQRLSLIPEFLGWID